MTDPNPHLLPLTAAILAGGRSARMGTDKGLLEIEGEPLLCRVVRVALATCHRVVVVTNRPEQVPMDRLPTGVPVLVDEVAWQGPMGGLATAMAHTDDEWLLALATDMPWLDPAMIRLLWEWRADGKVIVPWTEAGPEPLVSLYHRDCLPLARQAIAEGRRSLMVLLNGMPLVRVPEEALRAVDPTLRSLVNLNTPDDLARARQLQPPQGRPAWIRPLPKECGPPLSLERAIVRVLDVCGPLPWEQADLLDATGRVLAADLWAPDDQPPFDASAMDGYAFRSCDTDGASPQNPVELRVVANLFAGDIPPDLPLEAGQAIRIMTGALLPAGADAVEMMERVRNLGHAIQVDRPVTPGSHIRRRGTDIPGGSRIMAKGDLLLPLAVGLLAACGHRRIPVLRRPRVRIMGTGSELSSLDRDPGPGHIRCSNAWMVAAQVRAVGGIPIVAEPVGDSPQALARALAGGDPLSDDADMLITIGGMSEGDMDLVRPAVEALGEISFHGVAIRPGGGVAFGTCAGRPWLGLPGGPPGCAVAFEILGRPALRAMMGLDPHHHAEPAVLEADLAVRTGHRHFIWTRLRRDAEGVLHAMPMIGPKRSFFVTSTMVHGLLDVPADAVFLRAGQRLPALRISPDPESSP